MMRLSQLMNYPAITLPEMLSRTVEKSPSEIALIYFGAKITYSDLQDHVHRFAAALQALGIEKGDRVALFMPNCPQFVVGFFGALGAGAIVTPTSPIYTPREIAHQWNDAGASVIIADRKLQPVIEAALPQLKSVRHIILTGARQYYPKEFQKLMATLKRPSSHNWIRASNGSTVSFHEWETLLRTSKQPKRCGLTSSDIACLQYTGGTTGTSKGAMLSHSNLVINAFQANRWLTVGVDGPETMVAALPLFHIYALT